MICTAEHISLVHICIYINIISLQNALRKTSQTLVHSTEYKLVLYISNAAGLNKQQLFMPKPAHILLTNIHPCVFYQAFLTMCQICSWKEDRPSFQGQRTPFLMIQIDLICFSESSGTNFDAPSAARDHLFGRFMNKIGNGWQKL